MKRGAPQATTLVARRPLWVCTMLHRFCPECEILAPTGNQDVVVFFFSPIVPVKAQQLFLS